MGLRVNGHAMSDESAMRWSTPMMRSGASISPPAAMRTLYLTKFKARPIPKSVAMRRTKTSVAARKSMSFLRLTE